MVKLISLFGKLNDNFCHWVNIYHFALISSFKLTFSALWHDFGSLCLSKHPCKCNTNQQVWRKCSFACRESSVMKNESVDCEVYKKLLHFLQKLSTGNRSHLVHFGYRHCDRLLKISHEWYDEVSCYCLRVSCLEVTLKGQKTLAQLFCSDPETDAKRSFRYSGLVICDFLPFSPWSQNWKPVSSLLRIELSFSSHLQ